MMLAAGIGITAALVTLASCGNGDEDRFTAAAEKARTSTTSVTPATEVPTGSGEPSERPTNSGTAFPGDTTSTSVAVVSAPQALISAVDAFRSEPGAVKVMELTVQFPQSGRPYGLIQYVVPGSPTDVDERDWRDGEVHDAEPVRLTSLDDVSTAWDLDAVNWPAVAAALPGTQPLVEQEVGGPFEGSSGVTHLIASDGAPFYPGVVVRVYVDGGARHGGGYVALRPDGSVIDVVA